MPIDYSKWDNIDTNSKGKNFLYKTPALKAKTVAILAALLLVEAGLIGIASALETVQGVIV